MWKCFPVLLILIGLTTSAQELGVNLVMKRVIEKIKDDERALRERYTYTRSYSEVDLVSHKSRQSSDQTGKGTVILLGDVLSQDRYEYRLHGQSIYEGREVLLIGFSPKEKTFQPQEDNVVNQVLNNLKGAIYVAADDFAVLRLEAKLNKTPVRGLGPARTGVVYEMDGVFQQQEINDRTFPKEVAIRMKFSYLWGMFKKSKRIDITFQDFDLK